MTTYNESPELPATGLFHIQLIGGFSLSDAAGKPRAINSRKLQLLLAILVIKNGEKISRRELASILWSRHAEDNALTSLRQSLLRLKNLLGNEGENILCVDRQTLALNATFVSSDIGSVLNACQCANLNDLQLQIVAEDRLLSSLVAKDDAEITWLSTARQQLYEKVLRAVIQQLAEPDLCDQQRSKLHHTQTLLEGRLGLGSQSSEEDFPIKESSPSRLQSFK